MEPLPNQNDAPGPADPLPLTNERLLAMGQMHRPPQEWYDGPEEQLFELPARVFDEIDAAKREAESSFVRDCQADIDAATCQECGGPLGDTYTMRNGIRYCSMCASVGGE